MPLPVINSVNPTQQAEKPAMAFNNAFLTILHFSAPAPTSKWQCQITTRNYDAASGTLAPNEIANFHKVDLFDVAAYATEYPVFAQILGGVLVVAGLAQAEQAAQDDKAAAQALLSTVSKLPDSDPTKAAKVSGAALSLNTASDALQRARNALGATT